MPCGRENRDKSPSEKVDLASTIMILIETSKEGENVCQTTASRALYDDFSRRKAINIVTLARKLYFGR
jgi:hypothetical protein